MAIEAQYASVKKRLWMGVILVLAALWLWLGMRGVISGSHVVRQASKAGTASGRYDAEVASAAAPARTKRAVRESVAVRLTHGPERLREFMLPAMVIDGLPLDAALRKLMAAYDDACRKSGEIPLPLTFAISPGAARHVTVHLPAGNFKTSIQVLASLAGMKVRRNDLEYLFEPITNDRESVTQNLRVYSNIQKTLNQMTDVLPPLASSTSKSVQDCLDELVQLDPSTHVVLDASGELKVETRSTADAAVISELIKSLEEQPPLLIQSEVKLVELPADAHWTAPQQSQMTDDEAQKLMREVTQTQGAEMKSLPSVTSRNGQNATIEMSRDFIYPIDDAGTKFETRKVGKVMEVQTNFLGFGHEVDLQISDTTGTLDPETKKPIFNKRTNATNRSYGNDGGTKFFLQTRPDGSRTILLLKSQTIDATGRPIH